MDSVLLRVLGGLLLALIILRLSRVSPVGAKEHDLEWYRERYKWIDRFAVVALLIGLVTPAFAPRAGLLGLADNDFRLLSLSFFFGITLAVIAMAIPIQLSPRHSFREYHDYLDLKNGVSTWYAYLFVVPAYLFGCWGTISLLLENL